MTQYLGAVNLSAPSLLARVREWLQSQRWYAGKAREIVGLKKIDEVSLWRGSGLMLLEVEYAQGEPDVYSLPFVLREGEAAERLAMGRPDAIIRRFDLPSGQPPLVLADALADSEFPSDLLEMMADQRSDPLHMGFPATHVARSRSGKLAAWSGTLLSSLLSAERGKPASALLGGDQSNSCIVFGKLLILKVFRRIAPGMNPELEVGRFLTAVGFPNVPDLFGAIEYSPPGEPTEPQTVAVLQEFVTGVPAWKHALEQLAAYFERVAAAARRINDRSRRMLRRADLYGRMRGRPRRPYRLRMTISILRRCLDSGRPNCIWRSPPAMTIRRSPRSRFRPKITNRSTG